MFSLDAKIAELERELRQRARVYPALIEKGRLTQEKAEWQTTILEAILADYKAQIHTRQTSLFSR